VEDVDILFSDLEREVATHLVEKKMAGVTKGGRDFHVLGKGGFDPQAYFQNVVRRYLRIDLPQITFFTVTDTRTFTASIVNNKAVYRDRFDSVYGQENELDPQKAQKSHSNKNGES
jgi:hypothetical protein